ncbi:hypothetical protein ABB02_01767 [Clostridiaceae bacterium JG1575]|nr:hypothetical protein ABB02_01767 [Clostridiaceae bacterium JG1575]
MGPGPPGEPLMTLFDAAAEHYEAWYETEPGRYAEEVETKALFSLFPPDPLQVLDAGCGTGHFTRLFARLGHRMTGVDESGQMLRAALTHTPSALPISYEQMDLYHLEFPDAHFDAAVSVTTFEFLEHPQRAFEELFRVIRSGGVLLIGTILQGGLWANAYEKAAKSGHALFQKARFLSLPELLALSPETLVAMDTSLFQSPEAPHEDFTHAKEEVLRTVNPPGFGAFLFQKP